MAHLIAPEPIHEKAETLQDLCRLFQALAICKLLDQADVEKFGENLVRSAQARRYYLKKSREEGNLDDRFLGLSRVESVMDAVVAQDLDLAREIGSLSVDEWHDEWEYEDDFCYFLFLHRLVASTEFVASPEAAALLVRFEQIIEGQPSPRLALCRALTDRDGLAFWAAFESLLTEYRDTNDVKRARVTEYTADAKFWPNSFVSIEALAWLHVGRMFDLTSAEDFAYCPREALDAHGSADDLFESLDQALKQA